MYLLQGDVESAVFAHGEVVRVQVAGRVLQSVVLADLGHPRARIVVIGHEAFGACGAVFCHFLVEARRRVVIVATILPGQLRREAGKCVINGPGDDHVVVDADQEHDDEHSVAQALQGRHHPPK